MPKKRRYRMTSRAQAQGLTRQKIVNATMQLHEELGPRATSISAIAERAGVQRLTVYRHFPDDAALLQACTSRWLELNPPPNGDAWRTVEDPTERVAIALRAFYAYYSATRRMWLAAHRDAADVPGLRVPMRNFARFVAEIARGLAAPQPGSSDLQRMVDVTIQHALAFPTWADLEERGIQDDAKATLVGYWIAGIRARHDRG